MALMIPVIMAGGSIIGRIATTRLAKQLAGNLLKGYKIARKPASEVKGVPKITSINQAKNLKPATKVAGIATEEVTEPTVAAKPKPKSQPLRADPKKAPDAVKKRLADKNKKPSVLNRLSTATGTKGQKRIVTGGLTAASLATMIPKKDTGKATAKTTNKGTPIQEDLGSGRRKAKPKKETTAPKKETNFNVGVSKGGVSFNKAFAHFRKKGNKTFTWNGKKYTTELASEKKGKK